MSDKKSKPEHAKVMPAVIDETSKFLASPFPETTAEKRRVLADLMARKGTTELAKEGVYKIDYTEGGKEIMNAPVGVTDSHNPGKKKEMEGKINAAIPDSKLQDMLKDAASEGAAHLTDVVYGRGEAMGVIKRGLEKEGDKEFLNIGKFNKTHKGAADMLDKAPGFGGENPNGIILNEVSDRIGNVDKDAASPVAIQHMDTAVALSSGYIADQATKECGLDAKGIDAWGGGGAGGGSRTGISSRGSGTSRRQLEEDEERRRTGGKRSVATESYDSEREQALGILHKQLRSKGNETFYKQPKTDLSHSLASDWLSMKPPMNVVKSVKESGDTARLHQKFEKKLNALVAKSTPAAMRDIMQDVVIESSRILSEYFVSKNYKALVTEGLIAEMQKRGNEILIEKNGKTESAFFSAQRLKKAKTLEVSETNTAIVPTLVRKMEDIIRCRSMARKLTASMKDHIKDAADYLSTVVTEKDEQIQAYEALIIEMEAQGDELLIQGDIPKSYKDCAKYLRSLTSCQDLIGLSNSSLQSTTVSRLQAIMSKIHTTEYSQSVLSSVISEATRLLVSYIMLQGVKTEALQVVIEQLECAGDGLLLRHGAARKSNADGADLLRGKNTDQLIVASADPVVARKVQIKLDHLMEGHVPSKYKDVMDDVIAETTMYLAVHLIQPHVTKVCKCMKSVFVQCELWCDEILRRVARPCCTCSRHVSAQALSDLAPGEHVATAPGSMHASAPGTDIALRPCPTRSRISPSAPCPARKPTSGCDPTTSYMLYSTEYDRERQYVIGPTRLPRVPSHESADDSQGHSHVPHSFVSIFSPQRSETDWSTEFPQPGPSTTDVQQVSRESSPLSFYTPLGSTNHSEDSRENKHSSLFWQTPTMMYARINWNDSRTQLESSSDLPNASSPVKEAYSCRAPIVSTDQMSDWHSMMVSLTWNVQAWRNWIQETIDRALEHHHTSSDSPDESWGNFRRRIATEALQWRQYNLFSRQLTLRLALRYKDKRIVSPTRATVKTKVYMECQKEMLEIINMFNRWTHWLSVVVKETDSLQSPTNENNPSNDTRWNYFKNKVEEYADDWLKYNMHLKICWEYQYMSLIKDWLPTWCKDGPVWVVSACGAVPSGAVAAGAADGEALWVARTTHRCRVLPAALRPSRHCCVLYADGAVHHYTKYQVLCNANVAWVAWRAGEVGARAVRVACGVHVGRVLYRGSHLLGAVHAPANRCHVVIFGRPFAFNCYELLVLTE
ncbi:uncharacterized protein isoform X2 [Choristoneura fumiferana]|uniref:uncharacterized protein isoform X2 n=1 Tax=Choristoneura fumiferana TaxID=7141 RepID=UPI003D15CDA9